MNRLRIDPGFFRQSGWMLITAMLGGVIFAAVQIVAQRMPTTQSQQYALFSTLMEVLGQLAIPALGLQTVFARQAALAQNEQQRRELTGTARTVLAGLIVLWLLFAGLAFAFQKPILNAYKITNPAALWITLFLALANLVLPVLYGILQGNQNFLWLGWSNVANSAGRLVTVSIMVKWFGGQAVGVMAGVLAGTGTSFGILVRQAWATLLGPSGPMAWRDWFRRVLPITFGLGAPTYMFTQDMIAVRQFFLDDTDAYAAARVVGMALVFMTVPMTAVMFPRIVRSVARAESTNVARQALFASALIGGIAAFGCTLFPELPLRILSPQAYWKMAWLVPWFAWGMLPLALAYVLINNLLAIGRYAVVPWLVLLAIGYGATLNAFHASFLQVAQVFGLFSALQLGVCLVFNWREARRAAKGPLPLASA